MFQRISQRPMELENKTNIFVLLFLNSATGQNLSRKAPIATIYGVSDILMETLHKMHHLVERHFNIHENRTIIKGQVINYSLITRFPHFNKLATVFVGEFRRFVNVSPSN